jgi:hypothetical protein
MKTKKRKIKKLMSCFHILKIKQSLTKLIPMGQGKQESNSFLAIDNESGKK